MPTGYYPVLENQPVDSGYEGGEESGVKPDTFQVISRPRTRIRCGARRFKEPELLEPKGEP